MHFLFTLFIFEESCYQEIPWRHVDKVRWCPIFLKVITIFSNAGLIICSNICKTSSPIFFPPNGLTLPPPLTLNDNWTSTTFVSDQMKGIQTFYVVLFKITSFTLSAGLSSKALKLSLLTIMWWKSVPFYKLEFAFSNTYLISSNTFSHTVANSSILTGVPRLRP